MQEKILKKVDILVTPEELAKIDFCARKELRSRNNFITKAVIKEINKEV